MIFGAILTLFKTVAIFIINLLPAFPNMASWVNTSISPLIDLVVAANYFINVQVVAGCLITVIVFTNIQFVWSGIMWIVRKIPGVS
jgi:hypothetical protein